VGRGIIRDDVDLAPRGWEGRAGNILKAMSLGSARRKGQDRIQAVQDLDGVFSSTQKTAA
jgi:hypothetical protein